ncbi:hypothetical protein Tco_0558584 [Tanacetum coccineum]
MAGFSVDQLIWSTPNGLFCKRCGKPIKHHRALSDQELRFSQDFSSNTIDTSTMSTLLLDDTRWRRTRVTSYFKHGPLQIGHSAKMGFAHHVYDCTRGTESGEERFTKFANNSCVIGGVAALLQTHLDNIIKQPRGCIVALWMMGMAHKVNGHQTSKISQTWMEIFEAFHPRCETFP